MGPADQCHVETTASRKYGGKRKEDLGRRGARTGEGVHMHTHTFRSVKYSACAAEQAQRDIRLPPIASSGRWRLPHGSAARSERLDRHQSE